MGIGDSAMAMNWARLHRRECCVAPYDYVGVQPSGCGRQAEAWTPTARQAATNFRAECTEHQRVPIKMRADQSIRAVRNFRAMPITGVAPTPSRRDDATREYAHRLRRFDRRL